MYPSKKAKKVRSPACASLYHVTASSRADQCDSVTAHVKQSLARARPTAFCATRGRLSSVRMQGREGRARTPRARRRGRSPCSFSTPSRVRTRMDGRSETQRTDADGRDARARTRTYGAHGYGLRRRGGSGNAVQCLQPREIGIWDLGARSEEIYVPCVFMYRWRWQDVALGMEIN